MKMKMFASYLILAFAVTLAAHYISQYMDLGKGLRGIIILIGIDILIASVFAAAFSWFFTKPLFHLVNVTKEISQGDLTQKAHISSQDEIGDLANSFNLMVDNLLNLVGNVKKTSEEIFSAAQNLSATSQEMNASTEEIAANVVNISRGAETQAEMVIKASARTKSLVASVKDVAESARMVASTASDVSQKALEGGESANRAIGEMSRIVETIEKSTTMVEGFRARALEINDAVAMITSIAQQTHLLALNATIEAARAGEHGRGFAVVADEIRKLSQNARDFTSQISKLAQTINQESEVVIQTMNESTLTAAKGSDVVAQAGLKLEEIVSSVLLTVEKIEDISVATGKQIDAAENMQASIEEISRIAEDNAASTQHASAAGQELTASMDEMSQSAQALANLSDRLKDVVGTFHLKSSDTLPDTRDEARSKPQLNDDPPAP